MQLNFPNASGNMAFIYSPTIKWEKEADDFKLRSPMGDGKPAEEG